MFNVNISLMLNYSFNKAAFVPRYYSNQSLALFLVKILVGYVSHHFKYLDMHNVTLMSTQMVLNHNKRQVNLQIFLTFRRFTVLRPEGRLLLSCFSDISLTSKIPSSITNFWNIVPTCNMQKYETDYHCQEKLRKSTARLKQIRPHIYVEQLVTLPF